MSFPDDGGYGRGNCVVVDDGFGVVVVVDDDGMNDAFVVVFEFHNGRFCWNGFDVVEIVVMAVVVVDSTEVEVDIVVDDDDGINIGSTIVLASGDWLIDDDGNGNLVELVGLYIKKEWMVIIQKQTKKFTYKWSDTINTFDWTTHTRYN